jgi:SAM-dependent methyltransferase
VTFKRRSALTQARRPVPITTWGEPGYAARMAHALAVGDAPVDRATHGFHSYTARMHPETARRAIAGLGLGKGDRLLDPFCGSGTVLVEAVLAGVTAAGLDASPLAVLVARAKTWGRDRRGLVARARAIAAAVVEEGRAARRAEYEPPPQRKLSQARKRALEGAFAPHMRREIEALAAAVAGDELLQAVLSSIAIKVSKQGGDPGRALARGMAARLFAHRAEELAAGLDALWREAPPGTRPPDIRIGDARSLPPALSGFDAIVTSPPYAGTYDYAGQHELRLALLGLPEAELRRVEIGARRNLGEPAGLARWDKDLRQVLAQMKRAVKPGAKIVLLIGDSVVGRPPRAVLAVPRVEAAAAQAGLTVVAGASAPRDMLGAGERAAFGADSKHEHLILLQA